VGRNFAAKGRPQDNPLILHLASAADVAPLVEEVPPLAERLMAAFWPGPLTIILRRRPIVPAVVSAGLPTVALRVPAHPVALALVASSEVPIAAPSANRSGRPSPTTADHVLADLGGRIDIVLDAGPTAVGVESTVIDLTTSPPAILRPGGVAVEALRELIPDLVVPAPRAGAAAEAPPRAPGMKYTHYAPRAPLTLVQGSAVGVSAAPAAFATTAAVAVLRRLAAAELDPAVGRRPGLLVSAETAAAYDDLVAAGAIRVVAGSRSALESVAARLFAGLRELDAAGATAIFAEGYGEEGLGLAVMNRLRKAATRVVEVTEEDT